MEQERTREPRFMRPNHPDPKVRHRERGRRRTGVPEHAGEDPRETLANPNQQHVNSDSDQAGARGGLLFDVALQVPARADVQETEAKSTRTGKEGGDHPLAVGAVLWAETPEHVPASLCSGHRHVRQHVCKRHDADENVSITVKCGTASLSWVMFPVQSQCGAKVACWGVPWCEWQVGFYWIWSRAEGAWGGEMTAELDCDVGGGLSPALAGALAGRGGWWGHGPARRGVCRPLHTARSLPPPAEDRSRVPPPPATPGVRLAALRKKCFSIAGAQGLYGKTASALGTGGWVRCLCDLPWGSHFKAISPTASEQASGPRDCGPP